MLGTLTMVDGMSAGGPGISIAESLASNVAGPHIVNGVLFNDGSGRLYLASSLADSSAPRFDGPMLEVIGYPEHTSDWDLAHAEVTGLREANGVLFFETAQISGVVAA